METRHTKHTILLVDDDPDLLDVFRDILGRLPSQPVIRTASTGARAIAMLEAEPVSLLICDLKMPKMDGLQVLSIVRRKYPELRTVVLTGDRRATAEHLQKELHLDEVRFELKPEEKVAVIKLLSDEGHRVAMVGDGVNDAPSLAMAHVGVAMGARGSDAALEQADVVLMHDRLENFLAAFRLSRISDIGGSHFGVWIEDARQQFFFSARHDRCEIRTDGKTFGAGTMA